jgi:hypothetical protein
VIFTDFKKFYSGFDVDFISKTLDIFLQHSDNSLFDEWRHALIDIDEVNVCLSGGVDSQFVVDLLNKLGKKVNIFIFSFVWDDCVFNSPDVLHAIRYCNKHNFKYTNIEIDYKQFLHSNQHLDVCKKYTASSPQIALQLKMLDFIDNINPIFLGGDTPLIEYNTNSKTSSIVGLSYQMYTTNAFFNYSTINNRLVIKDIFKINPKIQYLSYKHYNNTLIKYKLAYPAARGGEISHQPLRHLFYQELEANILLPLLKNTGFEILKMHLAKQTGIYDQFNLLYRHPLSATLKQEPWFREGPFKVNFRNKELVDQILNEHNDFCSTTENIKFVEVYNFNL